MTTPTEHTTHDLWCAAWLLAKGFPLRRLTGPKGGRRTFHFDPEARTEADTFYADRFTRDFIEGYHDALTLLKRTP